MPDRLESGGELGGRVVIVTGASRGIGAAIAEKAAAAGASVAVGYRTSQDSAEGVVARIHARGGSAAAFPGDVSDPGQVDQLVSAVATRLGPIDGLVNSAAVMATGDFLELALAEWETMIRNDVLSVVLMCRAVLPGMVARGSGSIVNLSSRLATAGSADSAPYASAKAAVETLTRSLALAYGPSGVRVNAIAPGTTNTDMGRRVIESPAGRERAARIPLRRFVEPAEVASVATFLLGEGAAGMTGQTLQVNGGELMT